MNKNYITHCKNCGAPATTEICPYCHVATGIQSKYADMEYPVIECKEASMNLYLIGISLFAATTFIFLGFSTLVLSNLVKMFFQRTMFGFEYLLFILGFISLVVGIIPINRNRKIKKHGKEIEATVYGYMDDNLFINGQPAQIVKLLVNTNEGKRFILYQLKDTKKLYQINSKIKLLVYKDMFKIKKEDK